MCHIFDANFLQLPEMMDNNPSAKNVHWSFSFQRAQETPKFPPSNISYFDFKFPTPSTPNAYFTHSQNTNYPQTNVQTNAHTLQIACSTLLDARYVLHITRSSTNTCILLRSCLHTTAMLSILSILWLVLSANKVNS